MNYRVNVVIDRNDIEYGRALKLFKVLDRLEELGFEPDVVGSKAESEINNPILVFSHYNGDTARVYGYVVKQLVRFSVEGYTVSYSFDRILDLNDEEYEEMREFAVSE